MERESLRLLLSQGLSVEKIAGRFGKHPSTISYWMDKYGLEAVNREKHAAKGGLERDALEPFVQGGASIAEIAAAMGRSKTTVRHWLLKYGLRTQNQAARRPTEMSAAAKLAGRLTVSMVCARHGETEFILEGRGYYRCKRCRVEAISRRRRKAKAILVAEAGGRCCVCGYSRHPAALTFHHLDPLQKRMNVSARGNAYALNTLRAEAGKCVLLCANCHAEVERGLTSLPLDYAGDPPES